MMNRVLVGQGMGRRLMVLGCGLFLFSQNTFPVCFPEDKVAEVEGALGYLSNSKNKVSELSELVSYVDIDFSTCILASAKDGDMHVQYMAGKIYENGVYVEKDMEASFEYFFQASTKGHPSAQTNLAMQYLVGKGVEKNIKQFLYWLGMAARNGDRRAQYNFAVVYLDGEYVKKDNAEAYKWFISAAQKDDVDAQYALGLMYYYGKGTKQDYDKSWFWLNLSSIAGNEKAEQTLNEWFDVIKVADNPGNRKKLVKNK